MRDFCGDCVDLSMVAEKNFGGYPKGEQTAFLVNVFAEVKEHYE